METVRETISPAAAWQAETISEDVRQSATATPLKPLHQASKYVSRLPAPAVLTNTAAAIPTTKTSAVPIRISL